MGIELKILILMAGTHQRRVHGPPLISYFTYFFLNNLISDFKDTIVHKQPGLARVFSDSEENLG